MSFEQEVKAVQDYELERQLHGPQDARQRLLAKIPHLDDVRWVYDDGGRQAAGFKGHTGDCVTRAIAIATEQSYLSIYGALILQAERERPGGKKVRSHPRTGIHKPTYRRYLAELGWEWTPTMKIGQGCKVHLLASELPSGRLIVKCSGHLVAVIDGLIHDTSDPSREGTRCVYGYWRKP